MTIEADLHTHSLASCCGLHTILELLKQAERKKLKALAITDHGPWLQSRINSVFFERFQNPIRKVRLYKGIECNIISQSGAIDLPPVYSKNCDIVLAGLHNIETGRGNPYYTEMLINALKTNPGIDIITHPNDENYPVDFKALADTAREYGAALEINNSKILYRRVDDKITLALIRACREAYCPVVVNSDTHSLHEVGETALAMKMLVREKFPREMILNRRFTVIEQFIKKRKSAKLLPYNLYREKNDFKAEPVLK
ncbi:MAG: hypothetical protein A2096_15290 [Spirochaetes bacterium GWF1_41_5]|nr:MAG: hypothetical protein A2096_15290 [Spirochaetes bacterium GWF1_41_5]HBE04628.1 hypothetical protein [Spirochaetia bacterium]